jgi:hypothetical protein
MGSYGSRSLALVAAGRRRFSGVCTISAAYVSLDEALHVGAPIEHTAIDSDVWAAAAFGALAV